MRQLGYKTKPSANTFFHRHKDYIAVVEKVFLELREHDIERAVIQAYNEQIKQWSDLLSKPKKTSEEKAEVLKVAKEIKNLINQRREMMEMVRNRVENTVDDAIEEESGATPKTMLERMNEEDE